MISLKPMTEAEFALFQEESGRVYREGLMTTLGITEEEARKRGEVEGKKLLPEGLKTPGAVLLSVLRGDERVGYLWFQINKRGTVAFTYAFEIFPQAKGHGYSAMLKAREHLKSLGVQKVALHAFAQNERAFELYKAVGFRIDSYSMSIEL